MRDRDTFIRASREIFRREEKYVYEFDMIDGRRIRRVSSPFYDEDGQLIGWNIFLSDVTSGNAI